MSPPPERRQQQITRRFTRGSADGFSRLTAPVAETVGAGALSLVRLGHMAGSTGVTLVDAPAAQSTSILAPMAWTVIDGTPGFAYDGAEDAVITSVEGVFAAMVRVQVTGLQDGAAARVQIGSVLVQNTPLHALAIKAPGYDEGIAVVTLAMNQRAAGSYILTAHLRPVALCNFYAVAEVYRYGIA